MEKVGDKFEKSVELPDTSERIYYKVGTSLASLCLLLNMPATLHTFSINSSVGAAVRPGSTTHQGERTMGGSVRMRVGVRARVAVSTALHCICDAM